MTLQTTFIGAARLLNSYGLDAAATHIGVDRAALWSVVLVDGPVVVPCRTDGPISFSNVIFSAPAPGGASRPPTEYQRLARRVRLGGGSTIRAVGGGDRLRPAPRRLPWALNRGQRT